MKVSIITATYNSQKNISDCLRSISGQTYNNIEHIVVDGGSTDNTLEVVKNSPSVSKWISEPDNGIYDALNKESNSPPEMSSAFCIRMICWPTALSLKELRTLSTKQPKIPLFSPV